MRVYITHCCSKKNDAFKGTGEHVTPDKLYAATPTRRFMQACAACQVSWAIFSDQYGVWFPNAKREWYDKHPNSVLEAEFATLLDDFKVRLESFDEIWFYYNPGRFHRLYRRLLSETCLRDRVRKFTHLGNIGRRSFESRRGGTDMSHRDPGQGSEGAIGAMKEAASILAELHICKAYGPKGRINGPNCQRFGYRDPKSGHWYWNVGELIHEAEARGSASEEEIRAVQERYRVPPRGEGLEKRETEMPPSPPTSRAELEHRFREAYVQLESVMRKRLPLPTSGPDHRTLGALIHDARTG